MSIAFVTGGSGYIGRNLIRGLCDAGFEVRALARSDTSAKIVEALGAVAINGDVLNEAALISGMQGCDAIVHAAADTNHGQGDSAQEKVNVEGTRTVFAAACQAGVKRGVHISTEAVLADGRPLIDVDETHPIPAKHAGGYSRTKALAERVALEQAAEGFSVCAVRPRFVWGRDDTTALPALIEAARSGKLKWIDGGNYLTSTTHVANVAAGVLTALERGVSGEAYFITDGAPVSFKRFVTDLLDTQAEPAPTGAVPGWLVRALISIGSALEGVTSGLIKPPMSAQEYATMAHQMTVSDTKARTQLGYVPVISIEEGMQELRK
jgi:nucleoside-diphosphate-sugar epimerase